MKPYRFSFVGADASVSDFIKLAKAVQAGNDLEDVDSHFLGNERVSTTRRKFQELKHRMGNLTSRQKGLLAEGTYDQQLQMTHLALCKSYQIYRDFITEVLAEKIILFDYTITDLDFNSFVSRKMVDHPELDDLAFSTLKKVKQVIYRMLNQVELIESTKSPILQVPILDEIAEQAILQDDPNLLTCFLYNHKRITSAL